LPGFKSAQPKPYRPSSPIIGLSLCDLKGDFTVTCHNCRTECKRKGRDRKGTQRYQCRQCSRTFLEPQEKYLDGMYLPVAKAELVLRMLLEGNSVSSVERLTEVHHTTILKLLVLAGERAERVMATKIVNVPVRDVQADEVWQFVGCKQKAKRPEHDPNWGDAWTFVALETHTKLVLNVTIGTRDQLTTDTFIEGLRQATARQRFQITTDGFAAYRSAISTTLGDRVDFAQLVKVYRATPEGEHRYSPAEVVSTEVVPVCGSPDPERICTSHVERSNLSLRMGQRRFTRLTNAFSKSFFHHCAATMLWYAFYNSCRIHRSLKVTPAMEAGIADHIWSVREILEAA
jgi:IS1 family transposase/transposase-like protein